MRDRVTGIYGILPADLETGELLAKAEAACAGGVRWLQLRDKRGDHGKNLKRTRQLIEIARKFGARIVVNDDVRLAREAGADGVHLGRSDAPDLAAARREAGEGLILGVSCKGDARFARHALECGADYLSFGSIFPTVTKRDATPIGLPRLERARALVPEANVVAIGGITPERLGAVRGAGADAAAVIAALFADDDVEARARAMVEAWGS